MHEQPTQCDIYLERTYTNERIYMKIAKDKQTNRVDSHANVVKHAFARAPILTTINKNE